jgi:hypothetical protein
MDRHRFLLTSLAGSGNRDQQHYARCKESHR